MTALNIFFRFVFFCFLFLVANVSFAQDNNTVQSLKAQLAAATNPRLTADLDNKLAYEMRVFNADSAQYFADAAFAVAEKENYDYGKALAWLSLSLVSTVKGKYLLTKEYADKTFALADKLGSDSLKGAALLSHAMGDHYLSNYEAAIEDALKSIDFYTKIKNEDGITRARLLIAQVYQVKNDLPAAEKILQDLALQPHNDKKIRVNIYHTLANIYGIQGNYTAALDQDKKALEICEENGLLYLKSPVYDNMANCYMYDGEHKKAKEYFQKCLDIDSSFGNKKQMADTYLNLGQLAILSNNFPEAIGHLQHAVVLAKESGYRQGEYSAWLMLSKAFKDNNQSDSALSAVNTGYTIKDSILNESTESRIAELQTLYDTEKKEQQLVLQKDRLNRQKYILIGLGVALILISFTGILYFRKRSLQNKIVLQQEVLKQQNIATRAIIEAEENERKRIAADLHDGIGQMMSAAKMNLSVFEHELNFNDEKQRAGFENVIGLVDESCKELRNVSHQMMPDALLKSGLANAVREFLTKIDTRILKVSFHSEGLQERLQPDVETVLYRVIQECVNNVLKHAAAGHLDISIIRETNAIDVTIEDNGRGFNTSASRDDDGIGMKNTASRIQYLRGTIQFSSSPGKGTLVAIHVPLN